MSMSGAETATYIKRIFKRTDKDTELYEALTDVIMDMKLRFNFDRFKVEAYSGSIAVAGDYKLEVPSDLGHIIGDVRCLDSTSSTVLVKVSKPRFDELYPNPNATGVATAKPTHWCLFGEQLLFGPVPEDTSYEYEFSYTTEEAETIVSGTAAVPFSDRYRECLRAGVLARLFAGLDDDVKAQKWLAFYENDLSKIVNSERSNSGAPAFVEYNDY